MRLTPEQERYARQRADISEFSFWMFLVGLLLVAAFCAFMIWTSP